MSFQRIIYDGDCIKYNLTESDYIEVLVHICEKFGWILIDRRGWCNNTQQYMYSIVKADDRSAIECRSFDYVAYAHHYLVTKSANQQLNSDSALELLLKICVTRAFAYGKNPKFYYSNAYFGAWERLEDVTSAEEAIVILDLYVNT